MVIARRRAPAGVCVFGAMLAGSLAPGDAALWLPMAAEAIAALHTAAATSEPAAEVHGLAFRTAGQIR